MSGPEGSGGEALTRVVAYQHGIYPRSEAVVAATRDLERGRTTKEDVDARVADDEQAFAALQREAGLDLFSDGLLRWQDVFRPLADAAGFPARTLLRWFDNNSFYRAPEVGDTVPVALGGAVPEVFERADGEAAVQGSRVATLPSPYTFSRAAHTSGDRDVLARDLGVRFLAPLAGALAGRGFDAIHLEEPWLPYHGIEDGGWAALEDGLQEIRTALDGRAALVLHTYFGDGAPHVDRLRKLPVDAVGIDFVETDLDALGSNWEVGVLAGILDGRRSLVEDPADVAAFAQRVAERLQPAALYLSSNSELEMLPTTVADQKVRVLGEAAATLRGALA
jgi:5-methyltetrahydropteroyltriglutamate--homocysteine methyltransferase